MGKETNGHANSQIRLKQADGVVTDSQINIFGGKRENKSMARLLLDNGSQKTYITEKLKNRLQLTEQSTQDIHFNKIDLEISEKKTVSIQVRSSIALGDRALSVTALTHPLMCSTFATQVAYRQYLHLQCLDFADSVLSGSDSICLLLGKRRAWQSIIKFNTDKTEEMSFSWKREKPIYSVDKLGDDNVSSKSEHKHLGLFLIQN